MNLSIRMYAAPVLARLHVGLRQLHEAVGMRVQELVSNHLIEYDCENPNQLGAPRSHYWLHAAFAAALPQNLNVTPAAATLSLRTPGINRALHDVVIQPVKAKNLAIPADEAAYHLRPREVPGLVPVFCRRHIVGLADGIRRIRQRDTRRGAKGTAYMACDPRGMLWFWFAQNVVQGQDRSLLPSNDEIIRAACTGACDFLQSRLTKS